MKKKNFLYNFFLSIFREPNITLIYEVVIFYFYFFNI